MLTGLPCCHAISCLKDQHLEVDEFVSDCYRDFYEAYYAPVIYLVNGVSLWVKTNVVDIQHPPIKRQPSRPKKKRNKKTGEQVRTTTQLKRAKFGIKWSKFQKDGHNKAICKPPPPKTQTPTQPTAELVAESTVVPYAQPNDESIA